MAVTDERLAELRRMVTGVGYASHSFRTALASALDELERLRANTFLPTDDAAAAYQSLLNRVSRVEQRLVAIEDEQDEPVVPKDASPSDVWETCQCGKPCVRCAIRGVELGPLCETCFRAVWQGCRVVDSDRLDEFFIETRQMLLKPLD